MVPCSQYNACETKYGAACRCPAGIYYLPCAHLANVACFHQVRVVVALEELNNGGHLMQAGNVLRGCLSRKGQLELATAPRMHIKLNVRQLPICLHT